MSSVSHWCERVDQWRVSAGAGGRDVRHGAAQHAADHRVGGAPPGHHQQRHGGHAVQQVRPVYAGDPIG